MLLPRIENAEITNMIVFLKILILQLLYSEHPNMRIKMMTVFGLRKKQDLHDNKRLWA